MDQNDNLPELERLPVRSYELIDELDATYPHRCRQLGEDEASHWLYAGKRALIDELLAMRELEIENAKELDKVVA